MTDDIGQRGSFHPGMTPQRAVDKGPMSLRATGGTGLAVLIVDDDARVRLGLRDMIQLSPDAAVVGEASSARSALELDLALHPDVVVLDLLLPRVEDGVGVLRELSARGTPVVAISVLGFLRAHALASGAFTFLEKGSPVIEQLMQAIRNAGRSV